MLRPAYFITVSRSTFRPQTARFLQCRRISIPSSWNIPGFRKGETKPPPKITYYEKDALSDEEPRKVEGDVHPEELEAAKVLKEIDKVENRLKEFEKSMTSGSALLEGLSEQDRMEVARVLRERKHELEGLAIRVTAPETEALPLVRRLNRSLRIVDTDESNEKERALLWKYYMRARAQPDILQAIPEPAWNLLWKSQTPITKANPNGMLHGKLLAEDMESVGKDPTMLQRVSQLEAMFVEGQQQEAVDKWEEIAGLIRGEHGEGLTPEFLDIGLRMYADIGDITRARQVLRELLEAHPHAGTRSVIPVLAAHVALGSEEHIQQAWMLYKLLKARLGRQITIEDYESVYLSFLQARQREPALAVFRDMMVTPKDEQGEGPPEEKMSLRVLELQALSDDVKSLNKVSLTSLGILPEAFRNRYFFASWIKKLIGMDETQAASEVVELMFERGIKPDAIHINGLVSGWLRTGTPENKQRAEQMAWTMVERRLEFAWRRRAKDRGENLPPGPSAAKTEEGVRIPPFLQRPVPMATTETYSILLHHYLRQNSYNYTRHLLNLLDIGEVKMSAKLMNNVLWSHIFTKKPRRAWAEFERLSRRVTPNIQTYVCLWQCMKDHIELPDYQTQRAYHFNPRSLFSQMQSWLTSLDPGQRRMETTVFRKILDDDESGTLYEKIIICFCITMDLPGVLEAMRGMKELFGAYPDEKTARKIVLQVARSKLPNETMPRRRRGVSALPQNKRNVDRVAKLLRSLYEQQQDAARQEGIDLETLDDRARSEMQLDLLSRLVLVVLEQDWSPESIAQGLQKARDDMGLQSVLGGPNSGIDIG